MDGVVQASDEELTINHNKGMLGLSQDLYSKIFSDLGDKLEGAAVKCKVLTSSTSAIREEGADEVRARAPNWFKMNNRLVTKSDYAFFMMNEPSIAGMFNSVKVMNNWEYVSTFYRWLNQLGVTKHDNPRFYLNPARFTKYGGASLSDAVDSNNVYIWYITNFGDVENINYDQMIKQCKSMMRDIKDLCQEPVLLPALPIKCEISSVPLKGKDNSELAATYLKTSQHTTVP